MAIVLFTGQPGHGKTQRAIFEALAFQRGGRQVYCCNVKGIDYAATGFMPLDDFTSWRDLPDGAVVLYDECYAAIPQRASGRKVPDHVEALATHRHRGMDFLLVAQQSNQLDSFLHGLIDRHVHVRRKFGTLFCNLLEWDRYQASPLKEAPVIRTRWRMDRAIWALYKSATVHTVKRRIPWYVIATPIAVAVVVGMFVALPMMMTRRGQQLEASPPEASGAAADAAAAGGGLLGPATQTDFLRADPIAWLQPRVIGAPWTAPAYDDRAAADPPRLACMSSTDSCTCITADQGTTYVVPDAVCRTIARHGAYDPTSSNGVPAQG